MGHHISDLAWLLRVGPLVSRTFLLQDWTTVRSSLATPITQSEFARLDMSGFLDLTTWLQVSEISAGNYYCAFQTSPTKPRSRASA